jgi:hypothetical protein
MKNIETSTLVTNFLISMNSVQEVQTLLLLTAGHLRVAIRDGEADPKLMPMVEYLELQGGRLKDFVRGLNEAPLLDPPAPEVNVKQPVDPKAN